MRPGPGDHSLDLGEHCGGPYGTLEADFGRSEGAYGVLREADPGPGGVPPGAPRAVTARRRRRRPGRRDGAGTWCVDGCAPALRCCARESLLTNV